MAAIEVRNAGGDRFGISVRDHGLIVDQPLEAGGSDAGPTPTELFVAGLASCVAFYAGRFLRRHGMTADELVVACDFTMSQDPPARVSAVELRLQLPKGFPESRRAALQRVVEHCTVHNSIRIAPDVTIDLAVDRQVA